MNLLLLIPALIIGLPIVGAIYQAIATARDRRNFPPPGRMIDVGGHRLHLHVTGKDTGRPTVILEAGMASFSSNFAWVQQELEPSTRIVAYDRAGLGWSDSGSKPRDAQRSAKELHTALQQAGIAPPYVLAGHSYGGLVVRAFADLTLLRIAGTDHLMNEIGSQEVGHVSERYVERLIEWLAQRVKQDTPRSTSRTRYSSAAIQSRSGGSPT